MAGRSLHLGVNQVDPGHYGAVSPLRRCEQDAADLAAWATAHGYTPMVLQGAAATAAALFAALDDAAKACRSGDTLLVTFSGHGSRVPDLSGDEAADAMDDTWCLFDRQVLDDELLAHWHRFAPGVRIVMVADSCHSGTMHRGERDPRVEGWRGLRNRERDSLVDRQAAFYRAIAQSCPPVAGPLGAHLLLLAACQEDERAAEGRDHGLLTGALLDAVGSCTSYPALHDRLRTALAGVQSPQLRTTSWPLELLAGAPFAVAP
jgi:metacaspase-1